MFLTPFIWTAVAMLALVFMQRWIHTHLHGLSLLITGKPERALIIYALVLLPGVLLHELSHWVTARLLGVKTGSFSLLPKVQRDGTVQLGYVEYFKTAKVGPLRESVIGAAPLVTGTAAIVAICYLVFDINSMAFALDAGNIQAMTAELQKLFTTTNALVWIYLLFTISNGMMPSATDRRAWPFFVIVLAVVAGILYLLGLTDLIVTSVAGPAGVVFGYLAFGLSVAAGVDILFIIFIAFAEALISRIRGVSVIYGNQDGLDDIDQLIL